MKPIHQPTPKPSPLIAAIAILQSAESARLHGRLTTARNKAHAAQALVALFLKRIERLP